MPNGEYIRKLSDLTTELFDLVVATCNVLESQDISASDLLDRAFDDELSGQNILSAIISELEELEARGVIDIPFESLPDASSGMIKCFELSQ